MKCALCNTHFKKSPYNPTDYCVGCIDEIDEVQYDSEFEVDVERLVNPAGRTKAMIYDERD